MAQPWVTYWLQSCTPRALADQVCVAELDGLLEGDLPVSDEAALLEVLLAPLSYSVSSTMATLSMQRPPVVAMEPVSRAMFSPWEKGEDPQEGLGLALLGLSHQLLEFEFFSSPSRPWAGHLCQVRATGG